MINRELYNTANSWLFQGKILIIYGPRQVGKTTLGKALLTSHASSGRYINCDILSNRQALQSTEPDQLQQFLGDKRIIVIDEAQRVENIGLTLKVLADHFPQLQIIATGSSSLDLANSVAEPLTGRAIQLMLYPITLREWQPHIEQISMDSTLENIMRFGSYPEVILMQDETKKRILLDNIVSNYLYKDILTFAGIKKPHIMQDLLQLIALQVGSEVSYRELSRTLGIAVKTVETYIDLLEKTFVLFRLRAFSRNLRKEIAKSFKLYFYDLGVRNSLIQSFNPLSMRNDVGALWENFCITERVKKNHYDSRYVNSYFWRTYDQQEIDYIEEAEGTLHAYECKFTQAKAKCPTAFMKHYPNSNFHVISRENAMPFVM